MLECVRIGPMLLSPSLSRKRVRTREAGRSGGASAGLGMVLAGLTGLAVVASAPRALAQSTPAGAYPAACASVSSNESDRAHSFYQAGKGYYDDANYDAAITQFRESYKKDCSKHELLIIISRAYELKGDRVAAADALEEFLRRVPGSPDAPQHKRRIENLRKQSAAPAAAPAAPARKAAPPVATAAPASSPAPPAAPAAQEHTLPPWIVVGVGGAVAIAGVVIVATAPSLPEGCDAQKQTCARLTNESDASFNDRQSRAGASQSQPVIGGVVIAGGVLAIGGGLLWHFLEPTGPAPSSASGFSMRRKTTLTPLVASGIAGLSLGGTF